jgi:hypothetical protein
MMKRACVVVPIYKSQWTAYEQISLSQCIKVLHNYDIFLVMPERLEADLKDHQLIREQKLGYKTFANAFFRDIPAYNRLLKSPGFYKAFLDYEFMLIHQLDAFVFKDELHNWCDLNYDTIGAPLFEGHDFAGKDSAIVGQGNGGFCLRKVKSCYDVVTRYRRLNFKREFEGPVAPFYLRWYRFIKHDLLFNWSGYPFQPIINEDLFWAELVPKVFPDFKVPKPAKAIGFSFEVNPGLLFARNGHELPFGCHAWWKYDLEFWRKHIEAYGYEL